MAAIRRLGLWTVRAVAVVGVVVLLAIVLGLVADVRAFDPTRGGYEPPYTGWTGTPIDWTAACVTSDGFRRHGRVIDVTLDCTTGMIGADLGGVHVNWRRVSPRAIAVHRPREACTAAGFTPRF